MSAFINTCPSCGAEESLDALLLRMIDDNTVRGLIADVLTASFPLGGIVVRYLRLHKPLKQQLRMEKVARLLAELVPDVQRNAIERSVAGKPIVNNVVVQVGNMRDAEINKANAGVPGVGAAASVSHARRSAPARVKA